MNKTKRDELRALLDKGTPEPWYIEGSQIRFSYGNDDEWDESVMVCDFPRILCELDHRSQDRVLVQELRNNTLALLDQLDRYEEALDTISKRRTNAPEIVASKVLRDTNGGEG